MLELLSTKLLLLLTIISVIYVYLRHYKYSYWKRLNVPHEAPSILFGNLRISDIFGNISHGEYFRKSYEKFKEYPFYGIYLFQRPIVVINDVELVKTVLIKEFLHFPDRGWINNGDFDALSNHLGVLPIGKWKRLRAKLSPMFSSGKLKQMYPLTVEISDELIDTCNRCLKTSDILEMKDIMARYTTDIISSVVYGFNVNSLKNPESEFRHYGVLANSNGKIRFLLAIFFPDILEKFKFPLFEKHIQNFFINTFRHAIDSRRRDKVERKDFLNLLMQLLDDGEIKEDNAEASNYSGIKKETVDGLSIDEASAQAFFFFLAGFETASSTAMYSFYELAMNPEIQKKLQQEIEEVANTTGFTYDSVMGMEYLSMVLDEVLRKHPSVPFLNRICTEDFTIPGSDYTIPKGMRVVVSVSGINHNPDIFPNPDNFDPSRFSKENQDSKINQINLGFGEGPRYCIGKRFGLMETKQAIISMLYNYNFYVCEKTQIPVKYSSEAVVQIAEGGIYLRLEPRRS